MNFYMMQSLPKTNGAAPQALTLDEATLDSMEPVASFEDDGTQGRASVQFPETTGRYLMVRWTPAAQADTSFTLAEVAALGGAQGTTLLAANTAVNAAETTDEADSTAQASDGKTMLDGKTVIDAKDMPGEGPAEEPQSPGEGPAPSLPQPPPFTFVPVLLPQQQPISP